MTSGLGGFEVPKSPSFNSRCLRKGIRACHQTGAKPVFLRPKYLNTCKSAAIRRAWEPVIALRVAARPLHQDIPVSRRPGFPTW